ncbi:ABC transporter ATP-binding protein [Acanthopleuribacter pedis]|uniref:ABC transporter ATP-binding protein n=1 Tax=Acanthopleuribacter pedis TaxID=442870 RepID=A0A8J7QBF9_9BACT|nr:ABC transporter ATP-binding protein [Acanthopleuribacter pedis]MBO1317846.1 ABC transporter ATP-binding protein [Acanthopleuribacter pedis]
MIKVNNLGMHFGRGRGHTQVLKDINFHLAPGEFVTIIGRSGSGKSTFLDILMGLVQPSEGTVERTNRASMSYVFQKPALLPWRNVLRNVYLPLQVRGVRRADRLKAGMDALRKVGLSYAAHLFPFQLSGGMAQRVAIARALAEDPDILLMDEPFSALDPILRENMNFNLLSLWQRTQKTILFVTHSIEEALILSDRIVILEGGRFVQSFEVDIERPRTYESFQDPRFSELYRQIRNALPHQPNLPRLAPEEEEDP